MTCPADQRLDGVTGIQVNSLATICMAVMDGLQVQWLLEPQADMIANFRVLSKLLLNLLDHPE